MPILFSERRPMARIGSESRDRLAADPSPRLRLGTFNGRRPTRESQIGNGGGAPPVSRFLYRPHYRRTKSESQRFFETLVVGDLLEDLAHFGSKNRQLNCARMGS
jgi:hypothetical protein